MGEQTGYSLALNAGAGVARHMGIAGVAVGFLFLAIFSFTTDSLLFLALLFVCSFGSTLLLPATHGQIPF